MPIGRPRFTPLIRCAAIAAGAAACSARPAEECADVPVPGAWGSSQAAPELVEIWRAGTGEGENLALPMDVAAAPDGRVAVVDFQLGVEGVASDGDWLGALVRPGQGPGEVELPLGAAFAANGDLLILDFGGAKAVVLDRDGELVREIRLDPVPLGKVYQGGEVYGLDLGSDGTALVHFQEPDPTGGGVLQTLFRLAPGGAPADTLRSVVVPSMGGDWPAGRGFIAPGWPRLKSAIAGDGRIAVAGHLDGYRIELIGPDGGSAEICRAVAGEPLRPDETEAGAPDGMPAEYREALASAPRPASPAPIGRLFFGSDGRLWVNRERPGQADMPLLGRAGALFDVFDAGGGYLGEIRAPQGAMLVAASADRVWTIEIGSLDVPSVVAYRLQYR